jgi:hypothetical protein
MTWLKRRLRSWLFEEERICPTDSPVVRNSVEVDGLSFNIMTATGGTVVQVRYYDRKTDRTGYHTHVIPDGEDIATRIGQIVSMEILRA